MAKSHRDEYMTKLAKEFPVYDWNNNFGYPTFKHREAIKKHGITKYHRKSFQLLPSQMGAGTVITTEQIGLII